MIEIIDKYFWHSAALLFTFYIVFALQKASRGLDGVLDWREAHRWVFMLCFVFMVVTKYIGTHWSIYEYLLAASGTIGLEMLREVIRGVLEIIGNKKRKEE